MADPPADLRPPRQPLLRRIRGARPVRGFLGDRPPAARPGCRPHTNSRRTSSWPGSAGPDRRLKTVQEPRRLVSPSVHRHGDRRLQRRVEPGARIGQSLEVRQGVDDHRDPPRLGGLRPSSGPTRAPHLRHLRSATTSPASSAVAAFVRAVGATRVERPRTSEPFPPGGAPFPTRVLAGPLSTFTAAARRDRYIAPAPDSGARADVVVNSIRPSWVRAGRRILSGSSATGDQPPPVRL